MNFDIVKSRGGDAKDVYLRACPGPTSTELPEQVVVGVAGNPISLPCPEWAGGTCSWNVSTSSSRVATDLSSCELKLNPLLPEDAGVHKCSTGQVELQVKVEPGPPVILEAKEGGRLEVKVGEEMRLECQSQ